MPRQKDGNYSVVDVMRWQQELDAEKRASKASVRGKMVEELSLFDQNQYVDLKIKEEKLKALQTKSIPIAHVRALITRRAAVLQKSLLAEGRRLAPRLAGKTQNQIRKIYEAAMLRLLEEYAKEPADGGA